MPYFQLWTFFAIAISILLLSPSSPLYQLGYKFISTKLFLKKKFYVFYRAKAKQLA